MKVYRMIPKITFFFTLVALSMISQKSIAAKKTPANVLVAAGINQTTGLPLIAASSDNGSTWRVRFTDAPSVPGGAFRAVSCTGAGSDMICAAVGSALAVSTNSGNSWISKSVANLPSGTQIPFVSVSCTGSGSSAVCVAAGAGNLVVSTDGGAIWSNVVLQGISSSANFSKVSCTGVGVSAACVAVGSSGDSSSTYQPILAESTDGAVTWNVVSSIPNLPANGNLYDVSCTGGSANPLCVAVGTVGIITSLDGGSTWEVSDSSPATSVSCTGVAANATCAAINGNQSTNVLVSQDEGSTWQGKPISNLPTPSPVGDFGWEGISCSSSSTADVTCVVVGNYLVNNGLDGDPLVAVSIDGGNTWATKAISNPPQDGNFNGVFCTDLVPNTVCIAVGNGNALESFRPILADSLDGGNTWTIKGIANLPAQTQGGFLSSSSTS